jgi:protein-tyrosine phosphatase
LYVGAQPEHGKAADLCDLNIGLVISMRGEARPHAAFGQPPLRSLWLRTYDTIFTPIRVRTLEAGVRAALPVMEQGQAVLVHCHVGRHRSVALAAAILIAQGYTAQAAMQLLRQKRAVADPQAWHIKRVIGKFERQWKRGNW